MFAVVPVYVGYFKLSCQAVHVIATGLNGVTGLAVLNDKMYVSCSGNQQIAVYSPTTFNFQQYLHCRCSHCGYQSESVISLCGCTGNYAYGNYTYQLKHLVACNVNKCIFVATNDQSFGFHNISKVAIGPNNTLSCWCIGSNVPLSLSITTSQSLLVAFSNIPFLKEYSLEGQLLRQISLQPASITSPVHAVQLSDHQFAVTHHGLTHGFSIVNSYGQLIRSYGGNAGAVNQPQEIAVDQLGRMFVADKGNNRILVMYHTTQSLSAYPLQLPANCTLGGPHSIRFDAVNNRLYVGEWNGGKVLCCQL